MEHILDFIEQLFLSDGIIIAVGCFVLGEIIKTLKNDKLNQLIPLINGLVGGLLGMFIADIFPNDSIIVCFIKGMALGWASTGAYELIRNMKEE